MFGLPVLDIGVIIAYFMIIIIIGIWAMRRIRNQEDYFLGGRRFGKLIQTFASFGQGTSVDTAVGVTTTTFTNGASGIWISLLMIFATPMYWITSPWFRRLRLLTMGDFFEERYGSKRMASMYAVIGTFGMMAAIAIAFTAMTKTMVAVTPKSFDELSPKEVIEYQKAIELEKLESTDYATLTIVEKTKLAELQMENPSKIFPHINEKVLIWVVCIVVMIYAVTGGLEAAFLTDLLQGSFIIVLSVIMLPFCWAKINVLYGGSGVIDALSTIHHRLPESFLDIFGSPTAIDFTWYYIAALTLMSVLNVVIQPNVLVSTGSAKDEYTARFGYTIGNFMKRFCTVLWGIFGLAAIVLYSESVQNPDLVWGYATRDLLGSLNIGLVGLMIACLMAALMSTADCLMITASSLLTHNLYRSYIVNRSERHYVLMGRFMGAVVVIGGAVIATQFDSLFLIMKFTWEINVIVAASFWLGMKWRRANKKAAWASILTTLILFSLAPIFTPILVPSLRTNTYLLKMTNPEPITRTFLAHEMDVNTREKEIEKWDKLNTMGKATGSRPLPIKAGDQFTKTERLPEKAIFWTQGIKVEKDGKMRGNGLLSFDLILIDKLGFDLSKNPYALNETIRILIRTITPFLILFIVALYISPDDKKRLDRFFVKMKTPVLINPKADKKEMALSYKNPHRYNHIKLFPNSNWELDKWDKVDIVGFSLSVLIVISIIAMLFITVSIGG